MADSQQQRQYVGAQIEAIHQNLRFLEAVVREPIGLTTDLKSLRESMEAAGAGDERERQAFADLTGRGKNPQPLGLAAGALVSSTLELLAGLTPEGDNGISAHWQDRE